LSSFYLCLKSATPATDSKKTDSKNTLQEPCKKPPLEIVRHNLATAQKRSIPTRRALSTSRLLVGETRVLDDSLSHCRRSQKKGKVHIYIRYTTANFWVLIKKYMYFSAFFLFFLCLFALSDRFI
jgi:hypothetical protein